MKNLIIYILCFVIAVLDMTYLKKHTIIRSFTVAIIAQAILISIYSAVEKYDKIGPINTDDYLFFFQILILGSTIHFMYKFMKHYDKH